MVASVMTREVRDNDSYTVISAVLRQHQKNKTVTMAQVMGNAENGEVANLSEDVALICQPLPQLET
ncbi:MAG: hypothetical protein MUF38_08460 [Anaerolineae bacterium]|jgi:hypothetical protein|nr:hypothetical protein [Anaerolineae bacterium]